MLSVLTSEGWRSVDPYNIIAVVRFDDDEPGSGYVSAVLIMVGGVEVAGMVQADALGAECSGPLLSVRPWRPADVLGKQVGRRN